MENDNDYTKFVKRQEERKLKFDTIYSQLKVNDLYFCSLINSWYIIKNVKHLDEIECLVLSYDTIYLHSIDIEAFEYLKKVKHLPNNLINKYKRYGININYDN